MDKLMDQILNKVYQYGLLTNDKNLLTDIVNFNEGRNKRDTISEYNDDSYFYYNLGYLGIVPAKWSLIVEKMEQIVSSKELETN